MALVSFRSRGFRRVLLVALGVLVAAQSASAAQIIVILDGSRSSSVPIDGVAKIDIARNALGDVLAEAPSNLEIGLVAYGHRRSEACDDVQLLAPPGAPDALLAAADDIQPIGRSPIAEAVRAAADAVTDPDGATIILVTDNSDNCIPDPCEAVSNIADENPNLTISVVGTALPEDEVADVSCFAELTGGLFLRADRAAGIAANIDQLIRAAWGPPPPPPATAMIAFPFDVFQGERFEIDYDGPAAPGDTIRIAWLGSPEDDYISAALVPADGAPVAMIAPREIGAYELRYWHAEEDRVLSRIPLPINAVLPVIEGPETAQIGADIIVRWDVAPRGGETIQIVDPNAVGVEPVIVAEAIRSARQMTISAPPEPGLYEIRLVAPPPSTEDPPQIRGNQPSRVLASTALEVVAANISFELEEPIIAGTEFQVRWTGPGAHLDEIRLAAPSDPDDVALDVAGIRAPVATLNAPTEPGTYELRYWSVATGKALGSQRIEVVAANASLTAPAEVIGGTAMAVEWTGPGQIGDRLVLSDATGQVIESARVPIFGDPVIFDVPSVAGTYMISYFAQRGTAPLAQTEVLVSEPTVSLSVVNAVDPGEAFEVNWTGPDGRFDEIRLVGPAPERPVLQAMRVGGASALTWTAPEEPGTYVVEYWSGGAGVVLRAVEIDVRCPECEEAPRAVAPELRLTPAE